MALSVPVLKASSGGEIANTSSSITTASFTPANNSILVVVVDSATTSANPFSAGMPLTISGGGLTWTQIVGIRSDPTNWNAGATAYYAQVTTGASMTITIGGLPVDSNGATQYSVFNQTGHNTGAPIGATASATLIGAASSPQNITLSGAPASTSYVFGSRSCISAVGGGTATPGSGFTELYNDPGNGVCAADLEYQTGTTSTTVGWATFINGDTAEESSMIGFEIKAAGGGGGPAAHPQALMIGI